MFVVTNLIRSAIGDHGTEVEHSYSITLRHYETNIVLNDQYCRVELIMDERHDRPDDFYFRR
jgi:hypothetical protein